tara:strand:- start:280 stop:621 length:342 start_codon:yes stop_codon:yes gene_type:complete
MNHDPLLIFIDAADDAIAMPASRMLGMTVAADATIIINFENVLGGVGATEDKRTFATLTVTADTELTVFKALAEKIAGIRRPNKDIGYVTICDDVNSVFAHADILSCTVTLDA